MPGAHSRRAKAAAARHMATGSAPRAAVKNRRKEYRGVAQLVARHIWEKPPGQVHNFISGCCAVGSAPALGAGGPGFESPHSDHLWQKNHLFRRFFCVFCSAFMFGTIAVQRQFKGQKDGESMSEDSHRNCQIPNQSLMAKYRAFGACNNQSSYCFRSSYMIA